MQILRKKARRFSLNNNNNNSKKQKQKMKKKPTKCMLFQLIFDFWFFCFHLFDRWIVFDHQHHHIIEWWFSDDFDVHCFKYYISIVVVFLGGGGDGDDGLWSFVVFFFVLWWWWSRKKKSKVSKLYVWCVSFHFVFFTRNLIDASQPAIIIIDDDQLCYNLW